MPMIELQLLIIITCTGYAIIAYLGIGIALRAFKGINLPFIEKICSEPSYKEKLKQIKIGKWEVCNEGHKCSQCNTVYNDEVWKSLGDTMNYCPKCGSCNKGID